MRKIILIFMLLGIISMSQAYYLYEYSNIVDAGLDDPMADFALFMYNGSMLISNGLVTTANQDINADTEANYVLPNVLAGNYSNIGGIGVDDDGEDQAHLYAKNGTLYGSSDRGTANMDRNFTLAAWTVNAAWTTTHVINRTDIIGAAVDTTAIDSAVFLGNCSYIANTNDETVTAGEAQAMDSLYSWEISSPYTCRDVVAIFIDNTADTMGAITYNGTIMVDTSQADLASTISFTESSKQLTIPSQYNFTFNSTTEIAGKRLMNRYEIAEGASDCTYSGSGDWVIDDGSTCYVGRFIHTGTVNIGENKLRVLNGKLRIVYVEGTVSGSVIARGGCYADGINGGIFVQGQSAGGFAAHLYCEP